MENFIFSVNVTIPIFLVMVIGWGLKQIGMLNDDFVTVANRFNFKVTLPFMLFRDISSVDIREVFDLKYVLFCALASTACFWLIWGGTKLFLKEKSMRGAFVQASFRSSAADGTCLYSKYLWKFCDGTAYDCKCSAALQYLFRDCAYV